MPQLLWLPGPPSFSPPLDHSLYFSSFLFISPFHSQLFSSASPFCLPMGKQQRRGRELCPQPATRSGVLTRGWQPGTRSQSAASSSAPRYTAHLYRHFLPPIPCSLNTLIVPGAPRTEQRHKASERQSLNQTSEFSLQLETKRRIQKQGKKGTILYLN